MASNVEEFLIKFFLDDKEALKGLKGIKKHYDELNKKVQQNVAVKKKESRAISDKNKLVSKEIALERARNTLRRKIIQAEKAGISVSGFKSTVAKAKKIQTIQKRTVELDTLILEINKKLSNERSKQTGSSSKVASNQNKSLNTEKQRLRINEKLLKQQDRFEGQARFRTIKQSNPEMADRLSAQFRRGASLFASTTSLDQKEKALAMMRRATNLTDDYAKAINRAKRQSIGLRAAQNGLVDSTRNMIRAYVSLYAVLGTTKEIIQTGQSFESMRAGMKAVSKDSNELQGSLQFLTKEAMRLGFPLLESAKGFQKLRAAAGDDIPLKDLKEGFTGVMEAATVFQLSADDTEGVIRA